MGSPDPFTLASYRFAFEQVHEDFKNKDQELVFRGQPAKIRVDSEPGKTYTGPHVKVQGDGSPRKATSSLPTSSFMRRLFPSTISIPTMKNSSPA